MQVLRVCLNQKMKLLLWITMQPERRTIIKEISNLKNKLMQPWINWPMEKEIHLFTVVS